MFQVKCNIATPTQHDIPMRARRIVAHCLHAIHPNYFGTHIGKHHCGKWPWPNAGDF